jgi:hypothetical protein
MAGIQRQQQQQQQGPTARIDPKTKSTTLYFVISPVPRVELQLLDWLPNIETATFVEDIRTTTAYFIPVETREMEILLIDSAVGRYRVMIEMILLQIFPPWARYSHQKYRNSHTMSTH